MAVVLMEALESALLVDATQAASGVAGALHLSKVQLYIAPIALIPTLLKSAFTFSTDANLAPVTLTWGAAYRRAIGGVAISSQLVEFQLADVINAGPCYGYVVLDSTSAVVQLAEAFPTPLNLTDVLSAISLAVEFALGGPNNGQAQVIN